MWLNKNVATCGISSKSLILFYNFFSFINFSDYFLFGTLEKNYVINSELEVCIEALKQAGLGMVAIPGLWLLTKPLKIFPKLY